ncbi:MAG TPA: hypothetical protein PKY10_02920 [Lentisphaeria bacterium]|nr:hypothetical protein [Lentisphaeria bacterium]
MTFSRATLNEWAAAQKLDLIGVAGPEHYAEVAPQWNPLSILPKAKSIIVFAREIPRSYFRGIEEGTLWMRVNRYLGADDGYCLCRRFEDNGFLAVPCSLLAQQRWPDGVEYKAGKPAPNVAPDIRVAAQLAGLGEIGYNGMFLTPQFGPRQALGMLLCEAKLDYDTPFLFGTICRREQCLACQTGCPAQALGPKAEVCQVGNQTAKIGVFNNEACRFCVNGAYPDTSCATAPPNRLAAACVRACIACLEDGGIVKTRFKAPFRRRAAWGLGTFGG